MKQMREKATLQKEEEAIQIVKTPKALLQSPSIKINTDCFKMDKVVNFRPTSTYICVQETKLIKCL